MNNCPSPNIPPAFEARKSKILKELSLPDAEYTDLSPKGSVDEGIRDLIRDINGLPGLVTTSSCAGRISVFLEGHKKSTASQQESERQFAPSGGKGTGRWLYVSHEPFHQPTNFGGAAPRSLHELFGMVPGNGKPPVPTDGHTLRLVRFHFEPLVSTFLAPTVPTLPFFIGFPLLAIAAPSSLQEETQPTNVHNRFFMS